MAKAQVEFTDLALILDWAFYDDDPMFSESNAYWDIYDVCRRIKETNPEFVQFLEENQRYF